MRLADFNIRATPPQLTRNVRKDLALAEALGLYVYCWQELGKFRRYIRALKAVFERDKWRHLFENKRNIITVRRRRYRVLKTRSKVLSPAAPWIPQPKRLANAVLLEDRWNDDADWVVNFHLTNGAKNRRWFPRFIKEARQRRWADEVDDLRDFITELLELSEELGLETPVWLCADSNSPRMPRLGEDQEDVVGDAPMHVSVLNPRKTRRRHRVISVKRLKTDHSGLVVEEDRAR